MFDEYIISKGANFNTIFQVFSHLTNIATSKVISISCFKYGNIPFPISSIFTPKTTS